VWPIRRSDHHDAGRLIKTIHLNQQLIERLILIGRARIVAASALTTQGIDFIDEDDAGRKLARPREQPPDTSCAHTGEFLLETRSRNREERYACFARCSPREQSLSRSWYPVKQDT